MLKDDPTVQRGGSKLRDATLPTYGIEKTQSHRWQKIAETTARTRSVTLDSQGTCSHARGLRRRHGCVVCHSFLLHSDRVRAHRRRRVLGPRRRQTGGGHTPSGLAHVWHRFVLYHRKKRRVPRVPTYIYGTRFGTRFLSPTTCAKWLAQVWHTLAHVGCFGRHKPPSTVRL